MLEKNILDSEYLEYKISPSQASINWWEKRRLAFNLIIICIQILIISFFWRGALQFGVFNTIFWSLAYTISANIFFSIGWGMSVLIEHYKLNFLKKIEKIRMLFFIMGTLFSIILTVALFKDTFYYFQVQYLWNR